jgi:Domain of unknown function (DUF4399)/Putative peptidoglycan binding domain
MRILARTLLVLIGIGCNSTCFGQAQGGPTPSPPGAAAYFIDLKDGATIGPKTLIHFGLRGMGVAPAGSDKENSGHHHLLIDADPPSLTEPILNDLNHLHFGGGQTEAEVTLSPGAHTLQLVLGDKNHVPHSPPVMSERIHVVVAEQPATAQNGSAPAGRHPSPPGAKVFFIDPHNGAVLSRTTTVRFGLVNMGIAPAGFEKSNTGHHHLLIDSSLPPMDEPIPNDLNHLHFGAGQTETQITLAPGTHTLILLLGDHRHVPHDPPVMSKPITVTVTGRQCEEEPLDPHKGREIQRVLAKKGLYPGSIDAIVGPLTRNAIKQYQGLNGSQETGCLTPDELKALLTTPTP